MQSILGRMIGISRSYALRRHLAKVPLPPEDNNLKMELWSDECDKLMLGDGQVNGRAKENYTEDGQKEEKKKRNHTNIL